jgi:hypothetical protein
MTADDVNLGVVEAADKFCVVMTADLSVALRAALLIARDERRQGL